MAEPQRLLESFHHRPGFAGQQFVSEGFHGWLKRVSG